MSMTHDEMISVITYHKNGGKVQCKHQADDDWLDFIECDPRWDFANFQYRAKSKPLVLWQLRSEVDTSYGTFRNRGEAELVMDRYNITHEKKLTIIKFVEVTE